MIWRLTAWLSVARYAGLLVLRAPFPRLKPGAIRFQPLRGLAFV